MQLSVGGTPVPLLSSGVVAPVLVTPVTCTIERGKNDTIDFGQVHRNTRDDYDGAGNLLATKQQTLSINCQPVPADGANYQVSVSYNGTTSDDYTRWGINSALRTSISDLFVTGTIRSVGDMRFVQFGIGQSLPLLFDAGTRRFTGTVDWSLVNYSKTAQAPEEYGNFTAAATYTVDVN
ncbi:type 1 fimbrial protein [Salmonella enterica subsp. enterica serovar Amager]|nr:type 1 fimbrial protein [Salmonella enterica subsp. enterica serovar Amager]